MSSSESSKSGRSQDGAGPSRQRGRPCERVSTTPSEIYRVGVRMPPFWPDDPEIWFAQIEGQFANANVTSDVTKFNYVIGHLDPQYAKEVKDIIISPPENNRYEKLKCELIKRLSASKDKKVHQLLMHEELGDRKPSQFLRHLQSLAGTDLPDDFLRSIWSSRLPSDIRTLLASQPHSNLEALADLADRVQDIASPVHHVAAAAPMAPGSVMESMANDIAELKRAVKSLTLQLGRQSRPQNRSKDRRNRSATRSNSSYRKFPQCWYHSKYGTEATRCQQPCDFGKAGNGQGGR